MPIRVIEISLLVGGVKINRSVCLCSFCYGALLIRVGECFMVARSLIIYGFLLVKCAFWITTLSFAKEEFSVGSLVLEFPI